MAQIFHPSANTIAKASIAGLVLLLAAGGWTFFSFQRSSYVTQVGFAQEQPVPFSHEHHIAGLGIDCRYCHTSVEDSSFAGMPSTGTCMNCHSQMWNDSPMLEPVRESWRTGKPLHWTRVHDLPDFVYFNHSIHVQKGVGCVTCHGDVSKMPLMWKDQTLFMQWCLDCHKAPEKFLRPRDKVFDLKWQPQGESQLEMGRRLVKEHNVKVEGLTNCSVCHR